MLRSTDRILTSHVGSLLRPVEVMKFIKAKDAQEPYDEDAFAAILDTTIDEVVREQTKVGIDIVNDGEFSRTSYANYVRDRLSGYEMTEPGGNIIGTLDQVRFGNLVPGMIRDRERFGDFVQMWRRVERTMFMPEELQSSVSRTTPPEVPVCTGPIRYRGMDELMVDLNRLKAILSRVDVSGAFVTAASPSIATYHFSNNEYYATTEEYLFAMADALNVEYKAITAVGFDLQIDAPDLCHRYDPQYLDEYMSWLSVRIAAINQALKGIPEERARLHVCWGSGNTPHTKDVPLRVIIDQVLKVKAPVAGGTRKVTLGRFWMSDNFGNAEGIARTWQSSAQALPGRAQSAGSTFHSTVASPSERAARTAEASYAPYGGRSTQGV